MINIAIDGLMGAGKSSLAKALAKKLGYKHLDTGAIFRTITVGLLQEGKKEPTEKDATDFLKKNKITLSFENDEQHMFLNGKDVTGLLRTNEVGAVASRISGFAIVRAKYLEIAKDFAKNYDCVIDGQDIATKTMPNADVKFFLTADEKVRAKRRFDELKAKKQDVTYDEVLKVLQERFKNDTTRKESPLHPTADSMIVDNTNMNFEQTVEYCLNLIKEKINVDKKINITIDGFVCSGKSTIAKALARKLGFKVFDTGAVYRGIACAFDYMGLKQSKISEKYIEKFASQINLEINFVDGVQHVKVNGIDHTAFLRTEHISELSAKISPFNCIREKVLQIQRNFAEKNDLVMEGRDIGSHVLPNADFKFFCTANEKIRAQRRFEQQKAMGNDVKFSTVLKELQERDYADTHREHGAIQKLPESIVIDTTNLNLEQSVDFCLKEMEKRGFKQN